MKNLVFVLFLLLFMFSCMQTTKDESIRPDTDITPKRDVQMQILNGIIHFATEEDFQGTLNQLDSISLDNWETQHGFTSMRTVYLQENLIDSTDETGLDELPIGEELMTLLNPSGIVVVDSWVFRLNHLTKKVRVLPVSEINNISDLINEADDNPLMKIFDFGDDVFSELADGLQKCNQECTKGDRDKDKDMEYCNSNNRKFGAKLKLKYVGFGIWHPITILFKHRCKLNCSSVNPAGGNFADFTEFSIAYTYSYTQRCMGSYNGWVDFCYLNLQNTKLCNTGRDYSLNIYNGTRCLSSFNVSAYAKWLNMCTTQMPFENASVTITN